MFSIFHAILFALWPFGLWILVQTTRFVTLEIGSSSALDVSLGFVGAYGRPVMFEMHERAEPESGTISFLLFGLHRSRTDM